MTDPAPAKAPKRNLWGVCQGCYRERKISAKTDTMLPHRKWIASPEPYGQMVPCEGSGYRPVIPLSERKPSNGQQAG